MRKQIEKLRRIPGVYRSIGLVVAVFGVIGVILTMTSHAATFSSMLEAENGTLAGNHGAGPTVGASGGASVSFGAAGPGPGPGEDANSAAVKLGWGTPTIVEDMDNLDNFGLYTASSDFGNKKPENITTSNGIMTISGKSDGTTGGMGHHHGQTHGRWEIRMKASGAEGCWRPVALLWPDAEDFPEGGEIDYAESGGDFGEVDFFLHYGSDNSQTHASTAVNATEWTYYAVEWTEDHVRGYVNGVQFFEDTEPSHIPPRAMHETFQLDAQDYDGSCDIDTQMNIDWLKIYDI